MTLHRLLMKLLNRSAPRQLQNERISGSEVREILEASDCWTKSSVFRQADGSYKLVNRPSLEYFLASSKISEYLYTKESFDCDDFAFALMGDITKWDADLAFGIIWVITATGNGHALNWFIDGEKKLWLVEPQNDKIFEPVGYRISWAVC